MDHNLLIEAVTDRYQVHDLVVIHMRPMPWPDGRERQEALACPPDYYVFTHAPLAHRAVNNRPPVENMSTAVPLSIDTQAAAWTETERANLTAMVDDGSPTHTIALPAAMHSSALRTHGHVMLFQRLRRIALATAQRALDRRGQATAFSPRHARLARSPGDPPRPQRRTRPSRRTPNLGAVQGLTGQYS